eukprot:2896548-Amphidinium_carterae.1
MMRPSYSMFCWRVTHWRICFAYCARLADPENKATALPTSHRQRSDTWCKKPGTAFTTEYRIPGADNRTLVIKCSIIQCSSMCGEGTAKASHEVH